MGLSPLVILLLIAATHLFKKKTYLFIFKGYMCVVLILCQTLQLHVSLVRRHWRHLSISVRLLLAFPEASSPSLPQK